MAGSTAPVHLPVPNIKRIASEITGYATKYISNPMDLVLLGRSRGSLYIGAVEATTPSRLQNNNIDVIVSLYPPVPISEQDQNRLELKSRRYYYDIRDDPSDERRFAAILPGIVNDIHQHLLDGDNVLVHCHRGIQRSATVVIEYLKKHAKMSPKTAIDHLRFVRPLVFINGVTFHGIVYSTPGPGPAAGPSSL